MNDRIVMCRKLGRELPGLARPPYKNELGQKIFAEISKEAWEGWLQESVRYVNTYRVDLGSADGQAFMMKQCARYFAFEEGDLPETAWTPPSHS